MVNYCAVPMCKNSSFTPGISFHRFPANEMIKKAWIIRMRRDESRCRKITKYSRVCSAHFIESDFKKLKSGRRELKVYAEPSIFPFPSVSSTQKPLCIIPRRPPPIKKTKTEGFARWCLPRKKKSVSSSAKPVKKCDSKPVILDKALQEIALINNATVSTVSLGNKVAAVVCATAEPSENISHNLPVSQTPTKVVLKFVPDVSAKRTQSYIPVFYVVPHDTEEN